MEDKNMKRQLYALEGRRDFMKLAGIIATSAFLPNSVYGFVANNAKITETTSYSALSHFIIMEKASMLARGDARMGSLMRHALHTDVNQLTPGNSFFMGMTFPFKNDALLNAMAKLKSGVKSINLNYKDTERLSILTGALAFRAIKKQLDEANKNNKVSDVSDELKMCYQDACLLRYYYIRGTSENSGSKLASLLEQMLTRTLIRFHTNMPDEKAGPDWVLAMQDWRKHTHRYYELLGVAVLNPNPVVYDKVISKSGFFAQDDPLLVKVSSFNRISGLYGDEGIQISDDKGITDYNKIEDIRKNAKCTASKALLDAAVVVLYTDDFWRGGIDFKEFEDRVNAFI